METTDHGSKAIRAALKLGVREGQIGFDKVRNAKLYFKATTEQHDFASSPHFATSSPANSATTSPARHLL
jgi:hypothetical protein